MATALRITYDGTDYDFDERQISKVSEHNIQRIDKYQDPGGYHVMSRIGFPYKKITIHFYHLWLIGVTNIKTLYGKRDATTGQPVAMQLYYKYYIEPTSFIWVMMKRNDWIENYSKGRLQGKVTVPITFVQSSAEEDIAMEPFNHFAV